MSDDETEILGSHKLAPDGPFKLEMSVLFIGVSGEYEGYEAWATMDVPPGTVPDDATFCKLMKAAQSQVGDNFRLATRKEFVRAILCEQTGVDMNFSVPGPANFRLVEAPAANSPGDQP